MGLFDLFKKKPKRVLTWEEMADCYDFTGSPEEYFAKLFLERFSEYGIRTELAVQFDHYNRAISYIFEKGGRTVYVAILCPSYFYKRKALQEIMVSFEQQGIPVHRYFSDFRNDKEYVCDRVRSAIR